jgi:PAS domain S-box-containing protein
MNPKDQHKTKDQLIEELGALRRRLDGLVEEAWDRKLAEEEIRQSESRYRILIENLKDFVFTIDHGGKITFASQSSEEILGYKSEEMINKNVIDFIPEEERQRIIETVAKGMKGEKITQFQTQAITKPGDRVTVELTVSRIWENGKAVGALAIARDISERKRAEQALLDNEASLKKAQKLAHVGSWEWNIADNSFRMSDEMRRLYGIGDSDAFDNIQSLMEATLHPEDKELLARAAEAYISGVATGQPITYRIVRPDGDVRWILSMPPEVRRHDHDGKPELVIGTVQDITKRKLAEDALRDKEEFIRATLESTADGILAMDEKGRITNANTRFAEMWRVPKGLIQAGDDRKLLNYILDQLEDPQAFFQQIQELFVNVKESFETLEFKDGRTFEHNSCPMIREGKIAGRVWSFRDITERKRAEKALEAKSFELEAANKKLMELDELKDNFLSMVSHDLRTPMTGIVAYAQIMREGLGDIDEESQKKYLDIILQQSERLTRLINDLLDIQRFEAGKMALEFVSMDLVELINESIDAFQGICREKNITLEKNLPDRQIIITGARDRLHQVMANLLSNAVKFTPGHGRIVVSGEMASRDGTATVKVAVADTGPGIPPELQDKLFDKFQQADKPAKGKSQGSGLGLALVRQIIDYHNGQVGLQSAPGQGSVFYFILPIENRKEKYSKRSSENG